MASGTERSQLASDQAGEHLPVPRSKSPVVAQGRLPVSEFLLDRAGAASPFGDEVPLPLPVSDLAYVHPDEHAAPQHL